MTSPSPRVLHARLGLLRQARISALKLLELGRRVGGFELGRYGLGWHSPRPDLLAGTQNPERRRAARVEQPVGERLRVLVVAPVHRRALVTAREGLLLEPKEEALL